MQTYAVGIPTLRNVTKDFLRGLNTLIKQEMPGGRDLGAYARYVDPELVNGQEEYWRTNLPRLERIKQSVDPDDLFHNHQSVRPAGTMERDGSGAEQLVNMNIGKSAHSKTFMSRYENERVSNTLRRKSQK